MDEIERTGLFGERYHFSEPVLLYDQTSRLNIQRLEAETELRAIYEDRESLLPADQDHLFEDVNTHLAYSTNSL
jgi:hypothetical protein